RRSRHRPDGRCRAREAVAGRDRARRLRRGAGAARGTCQSTVRSRRPRSMMRLIRAMDMCVVVEGGPAAQLPKFCVSVTADKHVDFAKFTTYSWTHGKPSADKA